MIQYPINVTPQNMAVDATQNIIVDYTFQGDYLTNNIIHIYDYDTNELVYTRYILSGDGKPIKYNDDKAGFTIPADTLTNGHSYVIQMCMSQLTLDGSDFLCDMPVFGGKVEAASGDDSIYIKKGITSIYPWNYNDGAYEPDEVDNTQITNMVIKINGESHNIVSYQPNEEGDYGIIELDTPFGFTVTGGMSYEIFSNFYITPQNYFLTNSPATVTLSSTCYSDRINVEGTYSQDQNVMIKKYRLKLMWSNNSGFVDNTGSSQDTGLRARVIEETNDIYSQSIRYSFKSPYFHDMNNDNNVDDYYKIICECTTQNDVTQSYDTIIHIEPGDYSDTSIWRGNKLYEFKVWWDRNKGVVYHSLRGYGSGGVYHPSGDYELFREDLDSGEVIKLYPNHFNTTVEQELIGYDMTASTHGRYRYTLIKFDDSDGHRGGAIIPVHDETYTGDTLFPSATIDINENSYYITELDEFLFNDALIHPNEKAQQTQNFKTGDTWQFACEIENTTIVNNLDRMVHVGYNKYITSTSTKVNYMSGTLSATLGYINCAEKKFVDTIATIRAWRDFITQPKVFLLKSQKGDVWMVNVTDNPQTTYDETHHSIPTTFTFSWAECMDIINAHILDYDH